MTDWSQALEEAYASAPADEFVVSTLELIHPAFVDESDNADSVRIVLDERDWDLTLEADAPLFGGETKTFQALAMDVTLPEQVDGQMGSIKLALDNVPRTVWPKLQAAAKVRASARLVYREWVAVRDAESGAYVASTAPDLIIGDLTMRVVSASVLRIEGTATFVDLLNKGFPRRTFSREDFPGLFGAD
ncbi:DUF1833 family protein [uncultured Devosia sp.]|uniref:DUF1833 family protein n=1 Tax=uncultured Devosia sp. TaxID=211434 RepID=UPI002627DD62|nr:DUF1833 family protein [uncultured Devosia sp.]